MAFENAEPLPRRRPALATAWGMAQRWKGRILLAIVDQGCASTANFLLTIFYAVWLPLDGFGRYVIVWSISLLVESAQVSLIMDSMPAIVSRYGQRNRQRLDAAALWIVLAYGAVTSILILAALPAVEHWAPEFVLPLIALAAVNPFQRLYIFFRRLCYIRDRQDAAAAASAIYGATLLGGAFALFMTGLLSVHAAVLLWGLANGIAVIVVYLMGVVQLRRVVPAQVTWLVRQLWRSGRWLAGAAVGFWISNWGMLPLVAAIAGIEAAGIIRALQNLFTPIVQFNAALNLAILPRVADKVVSAGQGYARSFAIYSTAVFTAIVMIYAGIILSESHALLSLIYRKPEIVNAAHLLWPLGIAILLESARQGSSMALLALNRTWMFFISRVVGVTTFLIGALSLGHIMGAEGILWANALSHAVGTALLAYAAFRLQDGSAAVATARRPDRNKKLSTLPS